MQVLLSFRTVFTKLHWSCHCGQLEAYSKQNAIQLFHKERRWAWRHPPSVDNVYWKKSWRLKLPNLVMYILWFDHDRVGKLKPYFFNHNQNLSRMGSSRIKQHVHCPATKKTPLPGKPSSSSRLRNLQASYPQDTMVDASKNASESAKEIMIDHLPWPFCWQKLTDDKGA